MYYGHVLKNEKIERRILKSCFGDFWKRHSANPIWVVFLFYFHINPRKNAY